MTQPGHGLSYFALTQSLNSSALKRGTCNSMHVVAFNLGRKGWIPHSSHHPFKGLIAFNQSTRLT